VKSSVALIGLLLSCSTANAEWTIESVKSPPPEREMKRGFVPSRTDEATLQLECVNGAQLLSVSVAKDLSRGMIGSVVTFDERKPQSQLLQVFSNPRNVPLFDISARELMRAKRLRIELQPIESPSGSYDFDTRGAKKAVKAVVCDTRPKKSLLRRLSR
jgi:hypothetical protein